MGDKEVVTSSTGLKILITRLSHIGDCVLTLPMACRLCVPVFLRPGSVGSWNSRLINYWPITLPWMS